MGNANECHDALANMVLLYWYLCKKCCFKLKTFFWLH